MQIVPIIKAVGGLASSFGAGAVVGNAIRATTPENLSTAKKVAVAVGSVALCGIAGDMAGKYVENSIQSFADNIRNGRKIAHDIAETAEKAARDAKEDIADED